MDREALRQQALGRRSTDHEDAEIGLTHKRAVWECHYCQKQFSGERTFMNHKCKQKLKNDQLKSAVGLAAYAYYSEWMKLQKHSVPPIESFAESRFYTTFIKFAEHVTKTHMPNPSQFIKAMITHGKIPPALWCRDNVYAMYLQAYDGIVSPIQQFIESLDVIKDLAVDHHVEVACIFEALGPAAVISLIEKRKLSHWFLLASVKFRKWLQQLPQEDRDNISYALNAGAALERIQKEEQLFKEFGKAAAEVGL